MSVTAIGKCAFAGCSSLESITLPESVTIEDSTFAGCKSELLVERGRDAAFFWRPKKPHDETPHRINSSANVTKRNETRLHVNPLKGFPKKVSFDKRPVVTQTFFIFIPTLGNDPI